MCVLSSLLFLLCRTFFVDQLGALGILLAFCFVICTTIPDHTDLTIITCSTHRRNMLDRSGVHGSSHVAWPALATMAGRELMAQNALQMSRQN